MSDVRRDTAPIGSDELDEIERRAGAADAGDVARLVAEVRRLARLADARGDEILRLSRLLDDTVGERAGAGRTTA